MQDNRTPFGQHDPRVDLHTHGQTGAARADHRVEPTLHGAQPSVRPQAAPVADVPQYAPSAAAHPAAAHPAAAQAWHGQPGYDQPAYAQPVYSAQTQASQTQAAQTQAAHPVDVRSGYGFAHHDHGAYGAAYEDAQMDEGQEDFAAMPRLGVAQWAGATVSLALIVMIGVWGYKQMVRDVSGVPVIRALEGEARVIPEDPGGQLAVHQGLAVNSVTADGSAAAPADRLTLAPRQIGLSEEDMPMGEIAPATLTAAPSADPTNPYAVELEQIEPTSAPLASEVDGTVEDVEGTQLAAFVSPIPQPRPVRAATLASTSLDGVAGDILAAVGAASEIDPARVPAGTAAVQLGAFAQEEAARLKWDTLAAEFSDFMDGKQRLIVEASAGGKTFYRLRAVGFAGEDDSNRFCAALEALNASCVPVIVE